MVGQVVPQKALWTLHLSRDVVPCHVIWRGLWELKFSWFPKVRCVNPAGWVQPERVSLNWVSRFEKQICKVGLGTCLCKIIFACFASTWISTTSSIPEDLSGLPGIERGALWSRREQSFQNLPANEKHGTPARLWPQYLSLPTSGNLESPVWPRVECSCHSH